MGGDAGDPFEVVTVEEETPQDLDAFDDGLPLLLDGEEEINVLASLLRLNLERGFPEAPLPVEVLQRRHHVGHTGGIEVRVEEVVFQKGGDGTLQLIRLEGAVPLEEDLPEAVAGSPVDSVLHGDRRLVAGERGFDLWEDKPSLAEFAQELTLPLLDGPGGEDGASPEGGKDLGVEGGAQNPENHLLSLLHVEFQGRGTVLKDLGGRRDRCHQEALGDQKVLEARCGLLGALQGERVSDFDGEGPPQVCPLGAGDSGEEDSRDLGGLGNAEAEEQGEMSGRGLLDHDGEGVLGVAALLEEAVDLLPGSLFNLFVVSLSGEGCPEVRVDSLQEHAVGPS
ncbi:MAG: hypothetical protein BWY86_00430 [Candidatus Aminicenantes bacterium ADurb.Bin508]|nr:MAG: hypothetical protein BWY86_00430 [Candidatus Aminicenantes bacterium ADurb.Bin508]